jgi:hypothetical protein
MDLRGNELRKYLVDSTGSGLCPVVGYGINGVGPWSSAVRVNLFHSFNRFDV